MHLDLFQLEADITSQVTPVLTQLGFRVEQFPANVEEFYKPVGKSRALVGLRMVRLEPPGGLTPSKRMIQPRILHFQVIYQHLDLRSHQAVLNALPIVQDALTGYIPPNCAPNPLYQIEAGLVEVVQGLWMYSQMFELSVPYLKVVSP